MRILLITLLVPACGRIGFDGLGPGALLGDASGDGAGTNGDGPDATGSSADCGSTLALSDDFVATTRGAQWLLTPNTGYTISQGGGDLSVAFAATVGASLAAGYTESATVDLTGGCVIVRPDMLPNTSTSAYSYVVMANAANTSGIGFEIQGGALKAIHYENSSAAALVKQAPFDPVAHKVLRLREAVGIFYFDTSTDGASFTSFTMIADTLPPAALRMEIGASTAGSSVNNGGTVLWGPVSILLP
ncbi:MAG TPA: hypothetical protein VL326_23100 [Kofleriaceae bacterium]|nr:hypothetical protein [Kofleriaceae bacterium]